MKRSEINQIMRTADRFFRQQGFDLEPKVVRLLHRYGFDSRRDPAVIQSFQAKSSSIRAGETTELSWLGAPGLFAPQLNNIVNDNTGWSPIPPANVSHTGGRNIVISSFDPFTEAVFYRLISQ